MAAGCAARLAWVVFDEVQLEGKRRMSAADFLRGFQVRSGESLDFERSDARRGAFATMRGVRGGLRRRGRRLPRQRRLRRSVGGAVAFEILTLVGEGKGHSDDLLHSLPTEALSPEDRNLATALVMAYCAADCAGRAPGEAAGAARSEAGGAGGAGVAHGCVPVATMDRIPAHAVLNESVEMCRAAGQPTRRGW